MGGWSVATELVNQIRAQEAHAKAIVEAAKADAEKLIAEAETETAQVLKTMEAGARRDAALAIDQAKKSGREEAASMAVEAAAEAATVRQAAASRLDHAIKLVMERIVSA